MKIEFALVTKDYFHCAFEDPDLMVLLQKAAKITSGRVTRDDIVQMVQSGRYQLWVIFDSDPTSYKTYGVILTEIRQYPRRKFVCVQHCVAEPGMLQEAGVDCLKVLENFARDQSCTGVEFIGRFGWEPFALANKFKKTSVLYQKILD